jgi:pimeloyl-ACP methyl ester carboxylesterase
MRQAAAVLATPNRIADLTAIDVPSMVVHGELDPLVPFESAQEAAGRIPGAVFVALPGLGHDLPGPVARDLIERLGAFHAGMVRVG